MTLHYHTETIEPYLKVPRTPMPFVEVTPQDLNHKEWKTLCHTTMDTLFQQHEHNPLALRAAGNVAGLWQ